MANTYILVLFGILCAKAGGFLRDAVFASSFGTGREADIYFAVFGIASLIFTAIGSALSTLIIKNINKPKYSMPGMQKRYAAYFMRNISLLMLAITALLYIFAKPVVRLLIKDMSASDEMLALRIMYIMLPSLLFISVAYMMSGLLQNRRVFFTPAVMSLPYNVIVICALLLDIRDIEIISMITTFGWFLHIVILLPDFYRKGYSFFASAQGVAGKDTLDNTKETVFIFVSGLMFQLCFLIDKTFASSDEGLLSALNYASGLFITFSGIFVVALSSVVFPAISQNYEHGEMDYVRELIRYIIKLMMSIFVFYLVAVLFFGEDIIRVIYERGEFTHRSTELVAQAFVIYSFGIFGYLAQNVLNKLFYLAGKYSVTVISSLTVVLLKLVIDIFLAPGYGVNFAAVTTTVLLTLYAVFIAVRLKSIIGSYITRELLLTLLKIAVSAGACVAVVVLCKALVPPEVTEQTFGFIIPAAAGFAVYATGLALTGVLKDLFATPMSKTAKNK